MATLRRAQAMILTGNWRDSEPHLLRVAQDNPEIYSARRLLELVSLAKRAAPTGGKKAASL